MQNEKINCCDNYNHFEDERLGELVYSDLDIDPEITIYGHISPRCRALYNSTLIFLFLTLNNTSTEFKRTIMLLSILLFLGTPKILHKISNYS